MRTVFPKFLIPLLMIIMLSLVSGCSESERAACGTTSDCADNEVCRDGACIVPSTATCSKDQDCSPGYRCIANLCARNANSNTDAGMTDANSTNNGQQDTTPQTDIDDQDATPDTDNPRVIAVFPEDGTKNIAIDTTVKVTFDKRMDHNFSLNIYSFKLRDPDGRDFTESTLSYDEATETATLTPEKPLRAAARYEIIVTPDLSDEAGNSLYKTYTFSFFTAHSPPADHETVAELYAPVIYQGIRVLSGAGPNEDIPTTVDFDGDMNASNNKANAAALSADIRAHVYYHVTETQSHYFINYVLYYPTRTLTAPLSIHEHDLTGITVTVDKETMKVLLIEGVVAEDASLDPILSYRPDSSPMRVQGQVLRLKEVPDEAFEDDGKFPLFITAGRHLPCNWYVRGGETSAVKRCPEQTQQFPNGKEHGVVMRAGPTAQKFVEAVTNNDTGLKEMNYKLVPFVDTFWLNRSDFSCGLYTTHIVYKPDNRILELQDRPVGAEPDKPLTLPNKLCTTEDVSFGKLPFVWAKDDKSSGGQWFMDPIYRIAALFKLNSGTPISPDYCQNIFFNIDERTHANCDE